MRRYGHLGHVGEPLDGGPLRGIEFGATRHHLGLRTRPGADLRVAGTGGEIRRRLLRRDLGDRAADDDLPGHRKPRKHQAGVRVRGQLAALARRVICHEHEAPGIDLLQQDRTGARSTVGGRGRDDHRVRLGQAGRDRVGEPALELREPIGGEVVFGQAGRIAGATIVAPHRPKIESGRVLPVTVSARVRHHEPIQHSRIELREPLSYGTHPPGIAPRSADAQRSHPRRCRRQHMPDQSHARTPPGKMAVRRRRPGRPNPPTADRRSSPS